MTRIGVDIEANPSGLDQGFAQAEKRIGEFHGAVEKSTQDLTAASQKAAESLGQVGREVMNGNFSTIPETLARAAVSAPELAGAVFLLVAPFVAVTGAAVLMAKAYAEGHEEAKVFERTLIMTGNAAGMSAGQLMDAAHQVSEATHATQSATADVMNQLAATGKVGAESMNMAAQAAIDLERVGVASISATVKQFAELGDSPVKASEKLNEQYHYLTASIYEQIKALQDQGRDEEAAALAQNTFASELDARASKVRETLGTLERAWMGVKDTAKEAWDTMLNIGREDSLLQQLTKANENLKSGSYGAGGEAEARMKQAVLIAQVEAMLMGNEAQAESNKLQAAGIKWAQEGDKYLDRQAQMWKEVTRAEIEGATAGKSYEEILLRVNDIQAKYAEKGGSSKAPKVDEYEQLMNRLSGLDANYGKELGLLYGAYEKGKLGLDDYSASVELLIQKQPFATRAAQEEKKARDDVTRAQEHAGKALTDYNIRADEQVKAIQRQMDLLGKTPEQAAKINAFAEVDRNITALSKHYEEWRANVAAKGLDTSGIDHMIAALPQLAEEAKGATSDALDKLKGKQDELNASWEYGATEALRKYQLEVTNVAAQSEKLFTRAFAGIEDALTNFVKNGKVDFKSLTDSIISDLIKMQVQASITGPLAAAMKEGGGIGGLFGKLFGGGSGGGGTGLDSLGSSVNSSFPSGSDFSLFHSGGISGTDAGSGTRNLPASTFANAPRYHTGAIAGDEQPAVLLKGEGVFTEAQMRKLAPAGATPIVNVNIIGAPSQPKTETRQNGSGGFDINVIFEQAESYMSKRITQGQGLAPVVEQQYGLNRSAGAWR